MPKAVTDQHGKHRQGCKATASMHQCRNDITDTHIHDLKQRKPQHQCPCDAIPRTMRNLKTNGQRCTLKTESERRHLPYQSDMKNQSKE